MNAEFILQVLKDFSEHLPSEPRREGDEIHPVITDMKPLSNLMRKIQPNSCEAHHLVAKLHFLANDLSTALTVCSASLNIDPTFLKVYLMDIKFYSLTF